MFKKLVTCAVIGSALTGCATDLKRVEPAASTPLTAEKAKDKVENLWTEPALTQEGSPMVVIYTPFDIPEAMAKKPMHLELEPNATVKDLVAMLGKFGISIIISDKEAADQAFYMPSYKGSLGHLLSAVSRAADVWFTYEDGVITVSSKEKIGISIPQDEALAKKLSDGLSSIGITGGLSSADAGMAALELKYSQYLKTKNFLQGLTKNSALVSMQVAVITVDMNQSDSQGIDWSKLQFSLGKNSSSIFDPNGGSAPVQNYGTNTNYNGTTVSNGSTTTTSNSTNVANPTNTNTSGNGTNTTDASGNVMQNGSSSVVNTTLPAYLNTAMLSGTGGRLALANSVFSLAAFVNFLGGYGSTETLQSVMLKTSTGNKVELKSVTQIPYVSSVGVATTGTSTSNNNMGLLGSAKTETANDGITLKLTPTYDSRANTVSIDVDLSIQSVISFSSLQAGNQIGSLSQPTTADRSFNNKLRLRPGEFQVVGGITYESVAKHYSGPVGLRDTKYESKDLQIKKQTMFIVIRPTVRTFGAMEVEPSPELMQKGVAPTVDSGKSSKKTNAAAKG